MSTIGIFVIIKCGIFTKKFIKITIIYVEIFRP